MISVSKYVALFRNANVMLYLTKIIVIIALQGVYMNEGFILGLASAV